MEYGADRSEALIAGADAFEQTMRALMSSRTGGFAGWRTTSRLW
jgi:hypothetical protein